MLTEAEALRTIREYLLAYVPPEPDGTVKAWLVGSRAKGTARPDSDWDVLVLTTFRPGMARAPMKEDRIDVAPAVTLHLLMASEQDRDSDHQFIADWRKYGRQLLP